MSMIKVAIKIRPFIDAEKYGKCRPEWNVIDKNTIKSRDGSKSFDFDKIYDETQTIQEIFQGVAQPVVTDVLNGINGTIIAYGERSSGKTHCMAGTCEEPGIVSLAIHQIFDYIEKMKMTKDFLIRVAYFEIFSDTVNDLINEKFEEISKQLMESDEAGFQYAEVLPSELESLLNIYNKGNDLRTTEDLQSMDYRKNMMSSIFRITIESKECDNEIYRTSTLNFVELLGSQSGDLWSIENLIQELSENCENPTYASTLAKTLSSSLGGNAQTAFICTISLGDTNLSDFTLKFAEKAKKVKNRLTGNATDRSSIRMKDSLSMYIITSIKHEKTLEKESPNNQNSSESAFAIFEEADDENIDPNSQLPDNKQPPQVAKNPSITKSALIEKYSKKYSEQGMFSAGMEHFFKDFEDSPEEGPLDLSMKAENVEQDENKLPTHFVTSERKPLMIGTHMTVASEQIEKNATNVLKDVICDENICPVVEKLFKRPPVIKGAEDSIIVESPKDEDMVESQTIIELTATSYIDQIKGLANPSDQVTGFMNGIWDTVQVLITGNSDLQIKCDLLTKDNQDKNWEIELLNETMLSMRGEMTELEKKLNDKNEETAHPECNELIELQKRNKDLQSEVEITKALLEKDSNEISTLANENKDLSTSIAEMKEIFNDSSVRIDTAMNVLSDNEKEILQLKTEIAAMTSDREKEIEKHKIAFDQLTQECSAKVEESIGQLTLEHKIETEMLKDYYKKRIAEHERTIEELCLELSQQTESLCLGYEETIEEIKAQAELKACHYEETIQELNSIIGSQKQQLASQQSPKNRNQVEEEAFKLRKKIFLIESATGTSVRSLRLNYEQSYRRQRNYEKNRFATMAKEYEKCVKDLDEANLTIKHLSKHQKVQAHKIIQVGTSIINGKSTNKKDRSRFGTRANEVYQKLKSLDLTMTTVDPILDKENVPPKVFDSARRLYNLRKKTIDKLMDIETDLKSMDVFVQNIQEMTKEGEYDHDKPKKTVTFKDPIFVG